MIFTKENDSLNLLMDFSDLEKRKHKHFLEKQYAGVRGDIEQTLRISIIAKNFLSGMY